MYHQNFKQMRAKTQVFRDKLRTMEATASTRALLSLAADPDGNKRHVFTGLFIDALDSRVHRKELVGAIADDLNPLLVAYEDALELPIANDDKVPSFYTTRKLELDPEMFMAFRYDIARVSRANLNQKVV